MGDTTSLISAYKLDEDPTETTTVDAFGSNNLTKNGTIVSVAGQFGRANDFSASTDFWSIADASQTGLDITGDLSFGGWGQLSGLASAQHGFCGKDETTSYFMAVRTTGAMRFEANGTIATASTGAMVSATWTHLAVVLDTVGDTVKYYFDGLLDTTVTSFTAAPTNNTAAFQLGKGSVNFGGWGAEGGNEFIDEFFIFSRVITAAEIVDLKDNGIANFIAPSVVAAAAKPAKRKSRMLMGVGL